MLELKERGKGVGSYLGQRERKKRLMCGKYEEADDMFPKER